MNYTAITLLETDLVTDPTRNVLIARLNAPARQPAFFLPDEFTLLEAVCDRLVPQQAAERIDMAGQIDKRLTEGEGDGWRYDDLPPDAEAYRLGLRGITESAEVMFGNSFQNLSDVQQDKVLADIQSMVAPGETWKQLPADRFFEELMADAAGAYYSHPLAQAEINYVGMADGSGWERIGLNELEEREK
ncbi:MAG: gluconate 2-dehydrogenase subunit 3 family protein [Spirosoma sp.]|nr:gluconate 2-dehydrogenase subunit 3 family protein [Spirosoma sp.]